MARLAGALLTAAAVARAQDWFSLPQSPGVTGDYTAAERELVRRTDPNVQYSDTALDAHINFTEVLLAEGAKPMPNTKVLEPEEWSKLAGVELTDGGKVMEVHGTKVVMTSRGLQPAEQNVYFAAWRVEERPRTFALMIEDMIEDYRVYVGYLMPKVVPLLEAFRRQGQPVFWSNWLRRPDDGFYGALDRFYGPYGVKTKQNPMYVYAQDGSHPMSEVFPTQEELAAGRMLHSAHLSKFADLDADGRSKWLQQLRALGVDTLVMTGAWTEDCITATVFDATDKYNLDVILVSDGVGTATPSHFSGLDVMGAATSKVMTSAEVVAYMEAHAGDEAYVRPVTAGASRAAAAAAAAALPSPPASLSLTPVQLCLALAAVALVFFGLGNLAGARRSRQRTHGLSEPLVSDQVAAV